MKTFTTAELSEKTGISISTLGNYRRSFGLKHQKNKYGHLLFEENDISLYKKIQSLKDKGLARQEIIEKIIRPDSQTVQNKHIPEQETPILQNKTWRLPEASKELGIDKATLREWSKSYNVEIGVNKLGYKVLTNEQMNLFKQVKELTKN